TRSKRDWSSDVCSSDLDAVCAEPGATIGHGTQNDFVLLFDDDSRLEMHPETIATLADRRAGLGADGIIRIVRSAASGIPGADERSEERRVGKRQSSAER